MYYQTLKENFYTTYHLNQMIIILIVEIAMAPGSHHFIAYKFSDDYNGPLPENYTYRDIHDPYIYESPFNPEWIEILWHYKSILLSLVLSSPYGTIAFRGVALKITTDYDLDLNPHYFNYTDETIQGKYI